MSAVRALSFDDLYPRANALQRKVSHQSLRDFSDVLHRSSLSRPETKRESGTMSLAENPRTLGKRISDALWRRINSGAITRKHLQHALGVSNGTIDNLLGGYSDPSCNGWRGGSGYHHATEARSSTGAGQGARFEGRPVRPHDQRRDDHRVSFSAARYQGLAAGEPETSMGSRGHGGDEGLMRTTLALLLILTAGTGIGILALVIGAALISGVMR